MSDTLAPPPLTDAELLAWEERARTSPEDWPAQDVLRLIAEVKRAREEEQSPERQERFERLRAEVRVRNAELMRRLA